jgi:hypothetical protein
VVARSARRADVAAGGVDQARRLVAAWPVEPAEPQNRGHVPGPRVGEPARIGLGGRDRIGQPRRLERGILGEGNVVG